jgi:DMSO/TMAO reductase YedYZ molybdopterin-dependent catalytic subunit
VRKDERKALETVLPKLVESKERWAREGRLLTGTAPDPARPRLPPGQHRVESWPVLDLGVQPQLEPERWRLTLGGLVTIPLEWDWQTFLAQPQVKRRSDIHCVTAWSRFDNDWEGVAARHLLDLARPAPGARFVCLESHDGYTTNLPLEFFGAEDSLLAHSWQGKPLTREHGGPARVIVPQLYFWKSAKWLRHIELMAVDRFGFWEERGYHDRGDPWTEERYG